MGWYIAEQDSDDESNDFEDGNHVDVYIDACQKLRIPQLTTVLKEMEKPTGNLDFLYLKLKGTTALSVALPYNKVRQPRKKTNKTLPTLRYRRLIK